MKPYFEIGDQVVVIEHNVAFVAFVVAVGESSSLLKFAILDGNPHSMAKDGNGWVTNRYIFRMTQGELCPKTNS